MNPFLIASHLYLPFAAMQKQVTSLRKRDLFVDVPPGAFGPKAPCLVWQYDLSDAYVFALCLGEFYKASETACARRKNNKMKGALRTFESKVPRARDIRDALVHWKEEATPAGKAKNRFAQSETNWLKVSTSENEISIIVGDVKGVLKIDVLSAMEAASDLFGVLWHELSHIKQEWRGQDSKGGLLSTAQRPPRAKS
jgi:hypothetical protein